MPTWNYVAVHAYGVATFREQLRAIVGVEIAISRLEGKWKLSQNRSEADVTGVVDGLRGSDHAGDVEVADAMEALRQKGQR